MKNVPFHIAALGASAGGLNAIVEFFSQIKEAKGVAYVVLLHSLREGNSRLRGILSRYAALEVIDIEQGLEIKANKIYIAPSSKYVNLKGGKFHLTDRGPSELINRTIDHFFKSLSDDVGDKAIAIVMSGTGRDGTLGFQAVEAKNGITITQSPETAQFDGMPMSTLLFQKPMHVLPPKDMHSVITSVVAEKQCLARYKFSAAA